MNILMFISVSVHIIFSFIFTNYAISRSIYIICKSVVETYQYLSIKVPFTASQFLRLYLYALSC